MIDKAALLKEMLNVQQEINLSSEYETDARYVWPKRWDILFRRIRDWPDLEAAFGGTAEGAAMEDEAVSEQITLQPNPYQPDL